MLGTGWDRCFMTIRNLFLTCLNSITLIFAIEDIGYSIVSMLRQRMMTTDGLRNRLGVRHSGFLSTVFFKESGISGFHEELQHPASMSIVNDAWDYAGAAPMWNRRPGQGCATELTEHPDCMSAKHV